ncbi:NADPH-dependent F420 reductase [Spirosoma radiotolerans]|uniref:NADP oxidoreductase n=1 Tax=Spirosoma radiotolerans TaxID=1379870 RepID=A0A0E3V6W1_9BACT|nr:NADPH-dependent F420 reductase [Spirosoma radiotolerans]AKD54881.1 NADP oxidoreductase [Spirosoma radiotolerans]
MKKTVGILGAGNIAQTIATYLIRSGHEVTLSNTNAEKLSEVVRSLGTGAKAGSVTEAAAADIVFLALPWLSVPELANRIDSWDNRIVVDATNHFISPDFQVADLNGRTSTDVVSDYLPGARVVKAFNTLYFKVLAQPPQQNGGRRVLFLSGNDPDANAVVASLIEGFGFAAVNLGPLSVGGHLQQAKGPLASLNSIKV